MPVDDDLEAAEQPDLHVVHHDEPSLPRAGELCSLEAHGALRHGSGVLALMEVPCGEQGRFTIAVSGRYRQAVLVRRAKEGTQWSQAGTPTRRAVTNSGGTMAKGGPCT
jgi:hypothetical protein